MARDGVRSTVRKLDGSMNAMTTVLRRLGVPKGVGPALKKAKNEVGDLVARLEMVERRE